MFSESSKSRLNLQQKWLVVFFLMECEGRRTKDAHIMCINNHSLFYLTKFMVVMKISQLYAFVVSESEFRTNLQSFPVHSPQILRAYANVKSSMMINYAQKF